ncbi:hypothetical protein PR048_002235 [Dryococelus australis]|uniref:Uncharacterized protein n=1 Tax=Dryococelus australis TaxID=614101 RepID=A0ABQ9IL07_9NEOP|nr:hypothetical protein PR048_002235 [Dryococelus australis]
MRANKHGSSLIPFGCPNPFIIQNRALPDTAVQQKRGEATAGTTKEKHDVKNLCVSQRRVYKDELTLVVKMMTVIPLLRGERALYTPRLVWGDRHSSNKISTYRCWRTPGHDTIPPRSVGDILPSEKYKLLAILGIIYEMTRDSEFREKKCSYMLDFNTLRAYQQVPFDYWRLGPHTDTVQSVAKPRARVVARGYTVYPGGQILGTIFYKLFTQIDCLSPTKVNKVHSHAGSLRIIASGDRAEQQRWLAGFLWGLPFLPPFHAGAAQYSHHITLIDLKSRPILVTYSLTIHESSSSQHTSQNSVASGSYCDVKVCQFLIPKGDDWASVLEEVSNTVRTNGYNNINTRVLNSSLSQNESANSSGMRQGGSSSGRELCKRAYHSRQSCPLVAVTHDDASPSLPRVCASMHRQLRGGILFLSRDATDWSADVRPLLKAVHDKVSTFEINLRKMSRLLPWYILTGALSDMRPIKLVTMDGSSSVTVRRIKSVTSAHFTVKILYTHYFTVQRPLHVAETAGMKAGEAGDPEKTRRPAAWSGTILNGRRQHLLTYFPTGSQGNRELLSQHAVAYQKQFSSTEPHAANKTVGTPTSKEPPCLFVSVYSSTLCSEVPRLTPPPPKSAGPVAERALVAAAWPRSRRSCIDNSVCEIRGENRAGRCRWSTGFLGDFPFPPPLHSVVAPFSPHFTLISCQDLVVKRLPNLLTQPNSTQLRFADEILIMCRTNFNVFSQIVRLSRTRVPAKPGKVKEFEVVRDSENLEKSRKQSFARHTIVSDDGATFCLCCTASGHQDCQGMHSAPGGVKLNFRPRCFYTRGRLSSARLYPHGAFGNIASESCYACRHRTTVVGVPLWLVGRKARCRLLTARLLLSNGDKRSTTPMRCCQTLYFNCRSGRNATHVSQFAGGTSWLLWAPNHEIRKLRTKKCVSEAGARPTSHVQQRTYSPPTVYEQVVTQVTSPHTAVPPLIYNCLYASSNQRLKISLAHNQSPCPSTGLLFRQHD